MPAFARVLLGLWAARLVWIGLAVHAVLLLGSAHALLLAHPYVPLATLVAAAPDLVLVLLPISLPFCIALATAATIAVAERHQMLLDAALAGRDPRTLLLPVLGASLVLAAAMCWLTAAVIPAATYDTRYRVAASTRLQGSVALRLLRRSNLLDGVRLEFDRADGDELRGVRLVSTPDRQPFAVVAKRATLRALPGTGEVELELDDGRLLALHGDEPSTDMLFERYRATFDLGQRLEPDKRNLLDLQFYTDRELDLLPRQAAISTDYGRPPTPEQEERLAAIDTIRALRTQAGLLGFLFTALGIGWLGRQGGRRRIAFYLATCGMLLVQQVVLDAYARKIGPLPAAGRHAAMLEVATALAAVELRRWVRRRR